VRVGGRNLVRVGDVVRVRPSHRGARNGFDAVVRRISQTLSGQIEVEVFGGPAGRVPAVRTFRPDRLARYTSANARASTARRARRVEDHRHAPPVVDGTAPAGLVTRAPGGPP
jgi:hypothetical protein